MAQHLITTLDPGGDYDEFDWEDIESVSNAWKALLKRIQEQVDAGK